jgi:hypothetical protein
MFTAWVLDQQDRDGDVGDCARLIFEDINNGCAPSTFRDVIVWKRHFVAEHPKTSEQALVLLREAYVAYIASFSQ